MNLDKAKQYIADNEREVQPELEKYRHELRLRWQVREQLAAEKDAAVAHMQERLRQDYQARVDAVTPDMGAATPEAALAAFFGAIDMQDGKALENVLNPLTGGGAVLSGPVADIARGNLKANLLKCHYEGTGAPYDPGADQISLGPWKDLPHRYADTQERCEQDTQARRARLDLIQIKGRWFVAYSRFFFTKPKQ